MSIAELTRDASTRPYLSFDVFDTLIYRTTNHYTDVFDFVELRYNQQYDVKIQGFKETRIKAEADARRARNGKEITLDLIYENMPYSKSVQEVLKKLEMECEIDICVPNKTMTSVLNSFRKKGSQIIITTDMYLPRTVFEQILHKIGVEYDRLFISGEEGETKRSGRLFPIVLQKLGCGAGQMIHIGDDANNDIEQPQRLGIKAYERIEGEAMQVPYVTKGMRRSFVGQHLEQFLYRGLQNSDKSAEFVIGYTILGPFLWDFCHWIHRISKERMLDKLLFVAREGYLIQKVYEELFPEDKDTVEYFRLNKHLLRLPSLNSGDTTERFMRSIPLRNNLSWKDIFNYLGVTDHKQTTSTIKKEFPNFRYEDTFQTDTLKEECEERSILSHVISMQKTEIERQNKLLRMYLEQKDVLNKRVGLVNNSVNGSGQSLLESFLKEQNLNAAITGIQFIKSAKCDALLCERSVAWINQHRDLDFLASQFTQFALIFEHLMFEPQGTALKFEQNEGGKISVVCEDPRKEEENFEKISKVQEYTMQFIREYSKNLSLPLNGYGYDCFAEMLLHPRQEEALFIGNLWDDDVEGDKQILDLTTPFKKEFCLLKGIEGKGISWLAGYYAATNIAKIYRVLTETRIRIRYYRSGQKK